MDATISYADQFVIQQQAQYVPTAYRSLTAAAVSPVVTEQAANNNQQQQPSQVTIPIALDRATASASNSPFPATLTYDERCLIPQQTHGHYVPQLSAAQSDQQLQAAKRAASQRERTNSNLHSQFPKKSRSELLKEQAEILELQKAGSPRVTQETESGSR